MQSYSSRRSHKAERHFVPAAFRRDYVLRPPQYTIYTYRIAQEPRGDQGDWEKIRACDCPQEALRQASALYETRQFAKVEVKKLFFDLKSRRAAASTLKTFGPGHGQSPYKIGLVLIIAFALGGLMAHEGLGLVALLLQP